MVAQTLSNKERYSQFYTVGNPFRYEPFRAWFARIPAEDKAQPLLEPFAGANHIVGHMASECPELTWACYDIDPAAPGVLARDTLADFPAGHAICITNPPYIARNAAKRQGIPFPEVVFADGGEYDDLYKVSLRLMLDHCRWVAAIIPESFLTTGLFHDRLMTVVSVPEKLFDDTDHPTCVALFGPKEAARGADFDVYHGDARLGSYSELLRHTPTAWRSEFTFNDPVGEIGIVCIDDTRSASIRFVPGVEVPAERIKVSSRSKTRVSTPLIEGEDELSLVLERANEILAEFRAQTHDVFLTSFKGLRKDGRYRRRLDFALARKILSQAVGEVLPTSGPPAWDRAGDSPSALQLCLLGA
jgi:hypothetical protein